MYRPNLHYRVVQVTNEDDKLQRALTLVATSDGAGIVYAATVKAADAVHAALRDGRRRCRLYHGRSARPSARRARTTSWPARRA